MPVEPEAPRWALPDLHDVPEGRELVALGADLSPGMLLAGYRSGLFAMPDGRELGWWSPDPRGVLLPGQVHVPRSLRRSLSRFEVSIDESFAEVVAACADLRRPHGWISHEYMASYSELHRLGWAHSIEVWDSDGRLAGGLASHRNRFSFESINGKTGVDLKDGSVFHADGECAGAISDI